MIRIAGLRGLNSMQAVVRNDNSAMLNVFERAGFVRQPADEPGEVYLRLDLTASGAKKEP